MTELTGITWNHPRGYDPLVATATEFSWRDPNVRIRWEKRSLQAFGDSRVDELAKRYDFIVIDHPHVGELAASKADLEMCFNRIDKKLRMPESNLHFTTGDLIAYSKSYDDIRCVTMQGGQGEVKHWAFNDPSRRAGKYTDNPPSPEKYMKLTTRVTDLHPMTVIQNARTSGGGYVAMVPTQARHRWPCGNVEVGAREHLAGRHAR